MISDARANGSTWNYSLENHRTIGSRWFDHSKWDSGKGGFGREGNPGSKVNTKWHTSDIWLRKNFRLVAIPKTLRISLHHDEDAQVYLNGKLILERKDSCYPNTEFTMFPKKLPAFCKQAKNVIAVHCKQTSGGQCTSDLGMDSFDEAVDLAALIRKHAKNLMGEGAFNQYKGDPVTCKDISRPSPRKTNTKFWPSESGATTPRMYSAGKPILKGDVVSPAFPSVLTSQTAVIPEEYKTSKSSGRRRALAEWITPKTTPQPHGLWSTEFGNIISVRESYTSTSDFGFQGNLPTHPKLLDWLAVRFMESDWNIKAMHKLIMTSQAYRRSSAPSDECFEKDPLNDLLWRFDMRRLGAEEVRDSVLAAKGTINLAR